jgi:hypothetical protein
MLRLPIVAALVVLSASAFAQTSTLKGVKFGVGCTGPVSTFAPRLGACAMPESRARIWCPNGDVFDRNAFSGTELVPSLAVTRAICNLNQVL